MYIWDILMNEKYNEIRIEVRGCTLHQLCELADRIDLGMGSCDVLRYYGGKGKLYVKLSDSLMAEDMKNIRAKLQQIVNIVAP